jgi:internalin A
MKKRDLLFVSYSHRDTRYLKEFQPHLTFLEERGLLSAWSDQKIQPGTRWQQAIEEALDWTKVAIMFVSADFLVSDFINRYELPELLKAAQKGEVMIWPIIVSYCLFAESPLSAFQAMHDPSRPLDKLKKSERQQVWAHVAARLASTLK